MKEVNSYCDGVVTELGVWKARMYDVMRRIDKAPSADKANLVSQVNDLHIFIDEIESRVDSLRRECPADWKSHQVEVQTKFDQLKGRYNDLSANYSPGDIGG